MNAFWFLITVGVFIVAVFWITERNNLPAGMSSQEYCAQLQAQKQQEGDYSMSYGDRVKEAVHGCY